MLTTRDRSAALGVIDSLGTAVHLITVDDEGGLRLFAIEGRTENDLADPGDLEQIVIELALNARDARWGRADLAGGGTLTIAVERIPAEEVERVRSAMPDTGVGRNAATGARAFDLHFPTEERGIGTGLGLCC